MSRAKLVTLDKDWWKKDRKPHTNPVIVKAKPSVKLSDTYYSVKEVAARFRVSIDRIYDCINSGSLQAIPLGRSYRISHEAIEEFLSNSLAKKLVG